MKTEKRQLRNKSYKSAVKTMKRGIFQDIVLNQWGSIDTKLVRYQKQLQSGVNKGIYKKGTSSRCISRMMCFINKIKDLKTKILNQQDVNNNLKLLEVAIYDRVPAVKNKKNSSLRSAYCGNSGQ